MHLSTSNFERSIPNLPWPGLLIRVVAFTLIATAAWELCCRAVGYAPTLNDTSDLWADRREAVKPDSTVVIGDSRALFDLDLNELERIFAERPIQLSLVGSSAYPILLNLVEDEAFHGTVIVGMVPLMFFAPAGPPVETSEKALKHYRTRTISQKVNHQLEMLTQQNLAFLKQEDLTLSALLKKIPIDNRTGALIAPKLPPYFYTLDSERRARMVESCMRPGPLQTRVKEGWPALFSRPPPPNWIPPEAFSKKMAQASEDRFQNTVTKVNEFRARGGKVVFVRFPVSGKLKAIEDAATPRTQIWARLINETQAPGIYFEDYSELARFECPEWSHLSAPDSIEFTRALIPHLRSSLKL